MKTSSNEFQVKSLDKEIPMNSILDSSNYTYKIYEKYKRG